MVRPGDSLNARAQFFVPIRLCLSILASANIVLTNLTQSLLGRRTCIAQNDLLAQRPYQVTHGDFIKLLMSLTISWTGRPTLPIDVCLMYQHPALWYCLLLVHNTVRYNQIDHTCIFDVRFYKPKVWLCADLPCGLNSFLLYPMIVLMYHIAVRKLMKIWY